MQDITHPDDLPGNLPLFQEAVRTGAAFEIEKRYVRPNGSSVWVHNSVAILKDQAGQLLNTLAVSIDVTERKQSERHLQLLVAELNHRVKNTLAVVQSLAHQTFRPGRPPEEAIAAYEGRLAALAGAHNLLTSNNWEVSPLSDVVSAALRPFCANRCRMAGPQVLIPPRVAVSLTLALHELATNAEKYGAFACASGVVEIEWAVLPERELELRWTERGGQSVQPPTSTGFGMRLLKKALATDLEGSVQVDFHPEGLVCRVNAHLPEDGA
jgi:two-component sensor histidine kinase